MKKDSSMNPNLKLILPPPHEASFAKFITKSGAFTDGDLLVNRDGVRIVSHNEDETPPPIKPSDSHLSLADLDSIKVIGKGNGGIVQLVRHKWTNQFFALKVIQMNAEESRCRLVAQELKINQLAHNHYIVVCYQIFYDNGAIFIILEYMDGGSLADLLKQVLKGLIYLHHEKHVIHRDLKPSNLLINHRGEVKITDFGVSAILASTSGQANSFVGTFPYMSPERISGEKYDNRSDIWSLGLVLLECATGQFPYTPPDKAKGWGSFYDVMLAVVDHASPSAPEEFSPEFCSFISSCLQKDPQKRSSARQLLMHPFIKKFERFDVDLAAYFKDAGSPLATF
ncbi:mitogen-activated protein kinase kinase 2-like isoform X2 [Momordica charantia]|uniref:mitogen-activated protein kinase kinase n=1 Tax=Momordica charantia TaxID=3673 RepID=A0A6J1DKL0_MOMCH|nr:mitogen-activated protein kinase kinase 2-like isoform X2 [Momordica charantia]